MIVRETEHAFIMTHQHEHARLSGDIAKRFHAHLFLDETRIAEALHAVYEHDRGWIAMDDTPIWNDGHSAPFTFMDYPLLPKLLCYRQGIDEVEEGHDYAALLCSLHYSTFEVIQTSRLPEVVRFHDHETARQDRIRARLAPLDEEVIQRQLRILKLCDGLSLYVCLNEPGAAKENEHPWYKDGFAVTLVPGERYSANWLNEHDIRVAPSLFEQAFTATLAQKQVSKARIQRVGLHAAYQETEWTEQKVAFTAI